MRHVLRCTIACLALLLPLLAAGEARAQRPGRQPPQLGFAYPAGGARGTTFEITVGGQYLKDASEVLVSGEGVEAEIIDYIAPPSQKEIQAAREVFDAVQKKVREEAKDGPRPRPAEVFRKFVEAAKQKGITEKQIEAFQRYRQQRNDPKRQLNPQLSEALKLRVTVSAGAASGLRELRAVAKIGLSNPVRFRVDTLVEQREVEPNDELSEASEVTRLPAILNGQILPGDVDRWRIRARRGQKLVVRAQARELVPYLADAVPGWFQAVLVLYDAEGREVAYADDWRFDPDPVLLWEVPADGDYVIEIRDAIWRGREDFVYRLAVGELPFVRSIFPLGVRQGEKTAVTVDGWNIPADQRTLTVSFADAGVRSLHVVAGKLTSNEAPLAVDDLAATAEQEPNDAPAAARPLTLPTAVNGRIDRPGDRDVFRFSARAGERIVAEVEARRLGSPLDSRLELTDAAGAPLAANDDCPGTNCGMETHHADSAVAVTIPKDGDYLLHLADTQGKGGPAYAYRLRVCRPSPGFELRVVPSAVSARGSSTMPITVYALRRDGFAGDVLLRLKDAPEGFTLDGACIPAGCDKVMLTLEIPAKAPEKLTHLVLEGTATIDGREVSVPAVAADDMEQAFIYRHLVPTESWTVAVEPVTWQRTPWKVEGDSPLVLRPGATTVRVHIPGRPPPGKIELELVDAPAGVTIDSLTPVAGGLEVVLKTDAEKAVKGQRGNLIFNTFVYREPPPRKDAPPPAATGTTATGTTPAPAPPPAAVRIQRAPMGVMPAVPYEMQRVKGKV